MPRLDIFDLIIIITMALVGSGAAIWGIVILRPLRSPQALSNWLRVMQRRRTTPISIEQFDSETLSTLARYQRGAQGTLLIGIGSGVVLGVIAAIGLVRLPTTTFPNVGLQDTKYYVLLGIISMSGILGLGLTAVLISYSTHSSSAKRALPARRVGDYRSRWVFLVICATFIVCVTYAVFAIMHIQPLRDPLSGQTSQQQDLAIVLLISGMIVATIMVAEVCTRLIVSHPPAAPGLAPTIATQAQNAFLCQAVAQLWGPLNYCSVILLIAAESMFFVPSPIVALPMCAGFAYMAAGIYHIGIQTIRSWADINTAIELAAKP